MTKHREIRMRENTSKREIEIEAVDFPVKMVGDHSHVRMSVSTIIWGSSCPVWSPADRDFFPTGTGRKIPHCGDGVHTPPSPDKITIKSL